MSDATKVFLAVDLGASGGRVVGGVCDGQRLAMEDVFRFENGGTLLADRMYWNLLTLWSRVREGLTAAAARYGRRAVSVGVDTWGVDFGLLGRGDEPLGNPYHYRDRRTAGVLEQAFAVASREEIFDESGLQFMEFNSLYQLFAMKRDGSPLLDAADSFLMMPDLFHWLLSGEKSNEMTNASTSQLYNPRTRAWSDKLLERFGLPRKIFGRIAQPGETLGPLRRSLADETGLHGVNVVLPGTHDTASAVLAVPAASTPGARPDWCYISSGTWSLMGVEVPEPVVNERVRSLNFTNEGGVGGTTRLLKNIAGLWLVQECRRIWKQAGHEYGWSQLVQMAEDAPPRVSLILPDDPSFVAPPDMPQAIAEFCRKTGQPVPETPGATIRCVLESLALRYRMVLGWLESLVGGPINTIHIVGGGAQNRLLCQMAADACGRPVVAGPIEGTAIGNVLMQAVTAGVVGSVAEARQLVRRSFPVETYTPHYPVLWHEAYDRFERMSK